MLDGERKLSVTRVFFFFLGVVPQSLWNKREKEASPAAKQNGWCLYKKTPTPLWLLVGCGAK
jgi:hypothetical protein